MKTPLCDPQYRNNRGWNQGPPVRKTRGPSGTTSPIKGMGAFRYRFLLWILVVTVFNSSHVPFSVLKTIHGYTRSDFYLLKTAGLIVKVNKRYRLKEDIARMFGENMTAYVDIQKGRTTIMMSDKLRGMLGMRDTDFHKDTKPEVFHLSKENCPSLFT
ncbi:MAG: hypothetical protein WCJ93_07325 [Methanomicrobiales archaeon]